MIHINNLKMSILVLAVAAAWPCSSQTKIGSTTGPGDASAVLELQSNNQGLLPPRLTSTQRDAIASPAIGLTIYNTTVNCLQVYKGAGNGGWYDFCSTGGAFSFTNCSSASVVGTVGLGVTTNATITLNYVNSTGQTAGSFLSGTTNGLTLTAPGGVVTPLASGSGNITLTLSGTPAAAGAITIPIVLAGTVCNVPVTVAGCGDPTSTVGSTGCVAFTYRGAQVIYPTVRAKDGKVWLQQNLGAGRVATDAADANAYGDYFQWGRWDDGSQLPASATSTTPPAPNNPTGLAGGNNIFYTNLSWWSGGGSTDTWSGTAVSATNGKDPCAVLGTGWHIPTQAEWVAVINSSNENITNRSSAYSSNLKISSAGMRHGDGSMYMPGSNVWYWSSISGTTGQGIVMHIASGTPDPNGIVERGYAMSIRCIK